MSFLVLILNAMCHHFYTTGTASPSAASSVTQSLMSNSNTDTSKLAFIPTYGSALSRVAVRAHERAYELRKLLTCNLVECINSIYPRLYNISTLFRDVYDDETLLKLSNSYDDAHKLNSSSEEFSNFSNESIEVSEEYMMGASTNSVSFNNLLGRNAIGLQLNNPNSIKQDAATAGLASPSQENSVNNTSAILIAQLSKKLIHVLCPTAEVFEGTCTHLNNDEVCALSAVSVPEIVTFLPCSPSIHTHSYIFCHSLTNPNPHIHSRPDVPVG